MNRRLFLTAAASLPFSGQAQQLSACNRLTAQESASLSKALPDIYRDKSASLVALPLHTDAVTLAFLFSPPHISMMKQAGKKHLVVEMPTIFNAMFQAIAQGHMSPIELALKADIPWLGHPHLRTRIMRTIGIGLIMMQREGISVFCCDTVLTDNTREDLDAFNNFLKGTGPENKDANARYMASRRDDRNRLSLIQDATGNEPAVMALGIMHMQDHPTSLKSLIGAQNCTHTNLYKDENTFTQAHGQNCLPLCDFAGLIEPDLLYRTGTSQFPTAQKASPPVLAVN